jgi:amphi-Trp domain-containing protein
MSEQSIEFKKVMELADVVKYLEALAEGFRSRKVVVEKGEKILTLNPPTAMDLEMEVKQKKDKAKFSIELSWKSGSDKDLAEMIKISSEEPITGSEETPEDESA